ncbi:MAG: TGS domain-containing protein [Tannerellaceae bacterium]|jgi:GTP pyrophosphokinase|nr:TGS domain-containing protein [Tannerellaceae bacterium]
MDEAFFIPEERTAFLVRYRELVSAVDSFLEKEDLHLIKRIFREREGSDLHGLIGHMETALIVVNEIGLRREPLLAYVLYRPVSKALLSIEEVEHLLGRETAHLLRLFLKTTSLYARNTAVNTENFHNLLFSFAEDVRVLLLMIADRLYLMRKGKQLAEEERLRVSEEAGSLFAPLAHRLGLYAVKSELEDLVLKYTDPQQFEFIRHKLNETKRSRDAYIAQFIAPVSDRLLRAGLRFDIKGRTKSIHSINNKLKKQKVEFEGIYDLFAIRIILDTPPERERAECWYVYSLLTDMYQPNPSRMRDWISVSKSNGYESLHITVLGPQKRWVEVQIRTRRMDEVAERGLAAHWKYKGVTLPDFDIERNNEIYVFTPGGELIKLPQGATILDFAFAIHTALGSRCVSALVNGRNVPLKHVLRSGDTVTILTSPSQAPKQDWLTFVITARARTKIKQALREEAAKNVETAKETLRRRFKNRKIELDEAVFMRYTKRKGYKTLTDFYTDIASNHLDPNTVIEEYLELLRRENETLVTTDIRSADEFVPPPIVSVGEGEEILFDGQNVKGMEYKLASCCNPMRGDQVFGFISTQGIRIHRTDCPNASDMVHRFPHRIISARWSRLDDTNCVATLRITGRDDLTIVSSLTSVVTKENDISLRNLTIDTAAGLFQATLILSAPSPTAFTRLIKKLRPLKGITAIHRLS